MSECRFHTNIINERNPRDHEPSYRHQIHRTGGGLSGPREFGKPDFSFDDGPRTTVTTGGQAPHRWHTELSMVRGERTLLDTRRIIYANHLAGRSRRLTISGGLARRFGFVFSVNRNRATQISPINIWAQIFAADGTKRLTLDIDRQRFSALPAIGNIAQLAKRRSTARGETFALFDWHGKIEVF